MPIKIALPKGRLLAETATLLRRADWGLGSYHEAARLYRLKSARFPQLSAKVFHERDIPIQVAIGNYDLGICGLDWVEELLAKYPSSALVKVKNLGYGGGVLYLVGSKSEGASSVEKIRARPGVICIASEYPNLAESLALYLRLKQFSIFPLWGGADVYPPESADLALITGKTGQKSFDYDLVSVSNVRSYSTFLIANKGSWETKDLSELLGSIEDGLPLSEKHPPSSEVARVPVAARHPFSNQAVEDTVRLALPDGHQQEPTVSLLNGAGIWVEDYPSPTGNRRPAVNLDGVVVKVIRPQDMPLQVANGNFDLAITGKDWVREHLYQFPSSPVVELLNLKFGRVKIVAVVSQDLPVSDIYSLRQFSSEQLRPLRVASEYVNIADKFARDNHLGMYRIIPTWGASEAFLPEDADLLIENTQTGRTIAKHNLKIIDTIGQSSACLIGNISVACSSRKKARIDSIIKALRVTVGDS
ncbi:MAG: ATP phosphoribosyltransferase [Chloroflexi bacterium]|nr:ATP phosphoribosyltransferase [Chloroflexota bacterium]